jgi:hypothetical protein
MKLSGLQVVVYGAFFASGALSFVICTQVYRQAPCGTAIGAFLPLALALPFYRRLR